MSKYNQPISTFRRAWIAGARVRVLALKMLWDLKDNFIFF